MTIHARFLTALTIIFALTFIGSEFFTYKRAQQEALLDARTLAEQIRGILMSTRRVYHKQFINSGIPLTEKTVGFLPAYALSRISQDFRNWEGSGIIFNNVSDNPRNSNNKADPDEMESINFFRNNPEAKVWMKQILSADGKSIFHYAQPIWMEQYCMKCHGKKSDAPTTIQSVYTQSYNYQVGDLRGILSIKIPNTYIEDKFTLNFLQNFFIHLVAYLLIFLLIYQTWRNFVHKPLDNLMAGIQRISSGSYDRPIYSLEAEFSQIGDAFNKMATSIAKEIADRKLVQEQLLELNHSLTYRIEESTAKLNQTNSSLQKEMNERKLNEKTLRESEARFRLLLESTGEGIYGLDLKGCCTFANPSCMKMLGYKNVEEILGQNMHKLIHHTRKDGSKYPEKECHIFQTLRIGQGEFVSDELLWRSDGTSFIAEYRSFPIFHGDERVGAVVSFNDITNRKLSENELRQSEKKFRLLAETLEDVVWMSNPSIDTMLYISPAYEKVWGCSCQSLYDDPHSFIDAIHPDDKERIVAGLTKHGEGLWDFEYRIINGKGETLWIFDRGYPIYDDGGKVCQMIGLATDITKHKENEIALQNSLAEKESLLREVHHRVKNNIQIISSLLTLQSKNLKKKKASKHAAMEALDESRNRIHSMAKIHEQLYKSSNLSRVNFPEYIQSLIEDLFIVMGADDRDIHIKLDMDPMTLKIEQAIPCGLILNEMISNSFKHAFPNNRKGTVSIVAKALKGGFIDFVVADDGIGFYPDQDQINTLDTLGLSLINTLTRQIDGKLTWNRGVGTSVGIRFQKGNHNAN